MGEQQKRVLLLDGNNVYSRAWFTIGKNGVKVDVKKVIGMFKNMVIKMRREHIPDIVIIGWDGGRDEERMELLPTYKERDPKPSEFYNGIRQLQETIEAAAEHYIQIQMSGVECDDIIGTISQYYALLNYMVIIVSNDKDMLQLLEKNVVISHSKKGMIDDYKFKETHGFDPPYFVDYLAIVGDKDDAIPGVKGIGEAGAKELIGEMQTLDNVFENIKNILPKYAKKLEADKENALLSRKLIELKIINIDTRKIPS